MKNLNILFGLMLFTYSSASQALVMEKALCKTSDGKYSLSIIDNQGIGFVRTSHLGVNVQDADGQNVASYGLTYENPRIRSISFGTSTFKDTETNGQDFSLTTGSTNFGPSLKVKLNLAGESAEIDDDSVQCQFFGL